jgi:hypothetical protein
MISQTHISRVARRLRILSLISSARALKNLPFCRAFSEVMIESANFLKSSAYLETAFVEQIPDLASRFNLLVVLDEDIL